MRPCRITYCIQQHKKQYFFKNQEEDDGVKTTTWVGTPIDALKFQSPSHALTFIQKHLEHVSCSVHQNVDWGDVCWG